MGCCDQATTTIARTPTPEATVTKDTTSSGCCGGGAVDSSDACCAGSGAAGHTREPDAP